MRKVYGLIGFIFFIAAIILLWYAYSIGSQVESVTDLNAAWWYVPLIACGCLVIIGIRHTIQKNRNANCDKTKEYWNGLKCVPIINHVEEKTRSEQIVDELFNGIRYF